MATVIRSPVACARPVATPLTVQSSRHTKHLKRSRKQQGAGALSFARTLGGVNAACCQLVRGFEISPLNQQRLFDTDGGKVAEELMQCLGESKGLGTRFGAELESLFRFVLAQSNQIRFSFAGEEPNEPWIAAFCEAAVDALLAKGMQPVADKVTRIATACLQSVDQQKLAAVDEKSDATRKRKAAAKAAAAERHGSLVDCGAHRVPDSRSSVARRAGFDDDDFGEDGELFPDSDCEDDDCVWHRKRQRYCELMQRKGQAMDLKGRDPAEVRGARLVVYYDEDGTDQQNVPYLATAIEIAEAHDFMWVRFANGEDFKVTDDDEWRWA